MNTLLNPPLSKVVEKLFAEVESADQKIRQQFASIAPEERTALLRDMEDYKTFYTQMKDVPLAVSRETANLLYILVRLMSARNVVEFGTSFGVSTLHLAAGLRDNGGGKLVGSEFELGKIEKARRTLEQGGLSDLVEIRAGDALETLAHDLPESIDFILLDGAKHLYLPILALIEPRLRTGGLIVADNADMAPDYLAKVRDTRHGYFSLPFNEDVELTVRI